MNHIPPSNKREIETVLKRFARPKSDAELFYDLCFCICVPQVTFAKTKKVIERLMQESFYEKGMPLERLYELTREVRFKRKARYLLEVRSRIPEIRGVLKNLSKAPQETRKWLVENVYGLGMKTASHFLRNQGCRSLAIIDTHIIKFLKSEQPKGIKDYLRLESIFKDEADGQGVDVATLDAFVWKTYSGTSWQEFTF